MGGLLNGELESAAEMVRALRAGSVSSSELTARAIRRAEAWQPSTNAFSQSWADEAEEQARRLDAVATGERGHLAGVPIAVKDLFDVAGHQTTGCSRAFDGNVASADAPVIERIRGSGVVMIGKTNQHELAAGGTSLVSACGRTGNPWDPSRMTGGSSGGSGAAVAAGVVPWALGSDTGGSIRIPSSMCGTFGLKPTTGALPIEGMLPLAPSMDCPGPIASSLDDLMLLLGHMSGSPLPPLPPLARGARVAILEGFFADVVHPEVAGAVQAVAESLSRAETEIVLMDRPGIRDARHVWNVICCYEFARAYEHIRDRRPLIDRSVVDWLERGDRVTREELEAATGRRESIRVWFMDPLERVDALLIPTTPYPAPQGDQAELELEPGRVIDLGAVGPGFITSSVNLAGLPAMNLPAGRSSDGLPIGVSLVAGPGNEGVLFDLARRWVEASGYRPAWPALPSLPA